MRTYITGRTGRLGAVLEESFRKRGDEIARDIRNVNYLVFAHRYRGEEWYDAEMRANVTQVVRLIDAAMWAPGDTAIVIVSSVSATAPAINQSLAYNLSKAALNQLARCYATKYRINTVSPDTFTGDNPKVTKQQVANVISFLCSSLSSGINGQDIKVTG